MSLLRGVFWNLVYRFPARMIGCGRRPEPPPAIPAAESALGLRPRIALSSAQVLPEWITSTSPRNDFSSTGDYPLNFVSHWKGSPQSALCLPPLHTFPNDLNIAALILIAFIV